MRRRRVRNVPSMRNRRLVSVIAGLLSIVIFFKVSAPAIALGAAGAAESFVSASVEATLPGSVEKNAGVENPFSLRSLLTKLLPGFSLLDPSSLVSPAESGKAPAKEEQAQDETEQNGESSDNGDEAQTPAPAGTMSVEKTDLSPSAGGRYLNFEDLFIKSDSAYDLDLSALYNEKASFTLAADSPQVLIIHTHATESYMQEDRDYCTEADVDRRDDDEQNVVRVGTEIANTLTEKGIRVIHDTTHHDQPYTGSYTRSEETVTNYLAQYPDIKVVLDIHRDAAATADGGKVRPVAEIDGKSAAQVMILSGTGEVGLDFPNWQENLRFGVEIEKKMQELYPGLTRGLNLTEYRYNMHLAPGYLIMEVGMTGNTMDEAIYSGSLMGNAIYEVLKDKIEG